MDSSRRPRLVIAIGFFDWFSGYQETILAHGLSRYADVHVVTSNRVNPIFTPSHLQGLGMARGYQSGTQLERGVAVHRLATWKPFRGMVWSRHTGEVIRNLNPDAVLLMMPGQAFPVGSVRATGGARLVTAYGDNYGMPSQSAGDHDQQASLQARLLNAAFRIVKQPIYRYCNRRATAVACYTPNTITILKRVSPDVQLELLPLGFDESVFHFDPQRRARIRLRHGIEDDQLVVLSAGKLRREKQLELLVDAAAALSAGGAPIRLVLVGGDGGDYEGELRYRANTSGLAAPIVVIPFTSQVDLNSWYCAADVGVWPVQPAISIQQAMGTGLPVVIRKTAAVQHLLREDSGVWIDAASDVGALSNSILQALDMNGSDTYARQHRVRENAWLSGSGVSRRAAELLGLSVGSGED